MNACPTILTLAKKSSASFCLVSIFQNAVTTVIGAGRKTGSIQPRANAVCHRVRITTGSMAPIRLGPL